MTDQWQYDHRAFAVSEETDHQMTLRYIEAALGPELVSRISNIMANFNKGLYQLSMFMTYGNTPFYKKGNKKEMMPVNNRITRDGI